ncbi:MAG: hypothetical protein EXX96DRAFT_595847 [Benjaminiella poitrasii]|nr:MAG: hypothetical protein EXX96DRAFT_595847 [Benjaminiella poitrasii]
MANNTPSPLARPLRPKSTSPMHTVSVQNISFQNDIERNTFIVIYPSQIMLDCRDLILMIEEKKDYIIVGNTSYILRKDILKAIQNYPFVNSKSETAKFEPRSSDKSKEDQPKRPTNAFILYNNDLRKKVKTLFPNFSNSDISKLLGAMWKAVDGGIRDEYVKQAVQCRQMHKKMYPDFEYNLKRSSTTQKSTDTKAFGSDSWDNYFDRLFEKTTAESSNGALYADKSNKNEPENVSRLASQLGFELELPYLIQPLSSNSEATDEWNEVCNIVSQFFPENTDQNVLIDEQFWSSLDNLLK